MEKLLTKFPVFPALWPPWFVSMHAIDWEPWIEDNVKHYLKLIAVWRNGISRRSKHENRTSERLRVFNKKGKTPEKHLDHSEFIFTLKPLIWFRPAFPAVPVMWYYQEYCIDCHCWLRNINFVSRNSVLATTVVLGNICLTMERD